MEATEKATQDEQAESGVSYWYICPKCRGVFTLLGLSTCYTCISCDVFLIPYQKPQDSVDHPDHYNWFGIECISVVEHFSFNLGNVIKYIWRFEHKNGLSDLEKAAWYIQREIERLSDE